MKIRLHFMYAIKLHMHSSHARTPHRNTNHETLDSVAVATARASALTHSDPRQAGEKKSKDNFFCLHNFIVGIFFASVKMRSFARPSNAHLATCTQYALVKCSTYCEWWSYQCNLFFHPFQHTHTHAHSLATRCPIFVFLLSVFIIAEWTRNTTKKNDNRSQIYI